MRAWRVMAAVAVAGILAAACSSNPGKHATTTTIAEQGTTTTSTAGTTTTASTTPPTSGVSACTKVTATPGQTQGAAGTIIGTISLAEVGSGSCTITGYPTLTRFNASGAVVPITIVHGLTVNISGAATQPPSLVTLTPTQQAAFTFQYSDVTTGTETTCATSTTLSVTTPGASSASAPVPVTMAPCNNGTVEVSPIYAATAS